MRKFLISTCIVLFPGLFLHSCYYDSKEFLFPETGSTCDTTNVTYSGSIVPVLQNYCLSCHNSTSAGSVGGNINLEGYSHVKSVADNGSLMGAITHQGSYSFMPKGSAKLDDCTIGLFQRWIDAGTLDN